MALGSTAQTRATLKTYFMAGDKPTESQFADLITSAVNILDDANILPPAPISVSINANSGWTNDSYQLLGGYYGDSGGGYSQFSQYHNYLDVIHNMNGTVSAAFFVNNVQIHLGEAMDGNYTATNWTLSFRTYQLNANTIRIFCTNSNNLNNVAGQAVTIILNRIGNFG
jgi:hypothetical protein